MPIPEAETGITANGDGHCPGPSTAEILASDRHPPPQLLAPSPAATLDTSELSVDAYISGEFHHREVAAVWRHCWQMACREEQIPNAGDYLVYDIVDDSVIIVRDESGRIRAFVNSCPHRGTRICNDSGHGQQLRCPFHGLTWSLQGSLKNNPCGWDFLHVDEATLRLIPVRTGTWGGFVFVTFDAAAPDLSSWLESLPEHFQRWPLEQRFTAAHVVKRFDCNWKVALEAFLETFHVIGLHPESLPFFGDANAQIDVWPEQHHVSRMINVSGVASPHIAAHSSPQRVVDAAARFGLCEPGALTEGETPRQHIARSLRNSMQRQLGVDLSAYSDSEVMDVIEYYAFPNLIVFGGFGSPLAYRSRPDGNDPHRCIFEVWLLLPYPEGSQPPNPAPTRWLSGNERFGDVPELSHFGPILDQDADMMPRVQQGLRSNRKGTLTLGNYQEMRIRHMRRTLERYMNRL